MSDLHRSFIRKIKQQESAFGLSLLSEDVPTNINDDKTSISNLIKESSSNPRSKVTNRQLPNQQQDNEIIQAYNQFKESFFTEMEEYTDTTRSISFQTYYRAPTSKQDTVLFCLHGAGSSSMTFATFAQQIIEMTNSIGIFLFDIRGHGDSSPTTEYDILDFVQDVHFILSTFTTKPYYTNNSPIYLLGHSLGGAILSKYTSLHPDPQFNLQGLIMLDIVEETAVKSLSIMPQFIARRPPQFPTIERAIEWHMKSLLHNPESAKLSVPHLLNHHQGPLTWKTDLALTLPFWDSWFDGLADNFISFKGAKLLILSAHETLDKKLIIGQMQGKYQLVVFGGNNSKNNMSGHFVHEDLPKQTSVCVVEFINRTKGADGKKDALGGIIPKWGGKIHK